MTDTLANDIPVGINEVPVFADEPNRPKRRKPRRSVDPSPLTITSLLDIMTIILVFLLKSYSANPVSLKPARDLKLPSSTSDVPPHESIAVTVTNNHLLVNDEPVAVLDAGEVAESDLASSGFLIAPMFASLQEEVDRRKRLVQASGGEIEPSELLTVVADRHVPYRLLTQVMYTAGQAGLSEFKFAVIKR